VLLCLESEQNRQAYEGSNLANTELVCNRPIPFLFVPPEHQGRMKPILDSLQSL